MDIMFENFDFNDKPEYVLTEVNGVEIPKDYLDFISKHNGGKGAVGENAYVILFKLEELLQINKEYDISQYAPDYFVFGTDGGAMLLGYNAQRKVYYAVDSCNVDEDEIFYEADSLKRFFQKIDEELA